MQLAVGNIVEGKVTGITKFGAFIDLGDNNVGMVHISAIASTYVKEIRDHISENQTVKVKILSISEDGKIGLSIKKAIAPPVQNKNRAPKPDTWNKSRPSSAPMSFEDMLAKFKQTSEDKMSDLKRNMDVKRGSSRRGR